MSVDEEQFAEINNLFKNFDLWLGKDIENLLGPKTARAIQDKNKLPNRPLLVKQNNGHSLKNLTLSILLKING